MLREYSTPMSHQLTDDNDTLYKPLAQRAQNHPDETVAEYQDHTGKRWISVTAAEMNSTVRAAAKGLMALGVEKGDTVVIYSATRYQWGVIDFACSAIGAVLVPIYETDSYPQALSIITDVSPTVAFADSADRTLSLESAKETVEALTYVFSFEQSGLQALDDWGLSVSESDLEERIDTVKADDPATIVYTSGSTGKPKGAVLSHRNFLHLARAGYEVLPTMLEKPSRLLLFLPLAHCFARYIQYVLVGAHGVVGYVPSAAHLLTDLRTFKPTYLLGVPRVFEKVYNAASQKAGSGFKGRVLAKAYGHYVNWSKDEQEGASHSPSQIVEHAFYEKAVGATVRSALGNNLHWLACGGAPMDPDLAHFFNGIDGITFIQGYGMTETAAPCCVNFEDFNKIGTVGRPGPGISVKLADDNELLIAGPGVFLGYKDDPEKTAETIDSEGWLHSGDLADIDDDGFVTITGRKKDIIITAGGKNVVPSPMEQTISTCPIVSHAVVVGDAKPFIAALVTLEPDTLGTWLKSKKLDPSMSIEQASTNAAVRSFVQQYVDRANLDVSRAESVRKFVILPEDFTQEDGTLTPSQKVVRPAVIRHYADVISTQIYTPKPGSQPEPHPMSPVLAKVGKAAKDMNDDVTNFVTPFVEKASESVTPLLQKVQENTKPALDDTREKLEPLVAKARDDVKDSFNALKNRAAQSRNETKDDDDSDDTSRNDSSESSDSAE
ncbi:MAG: AMP-dependent synthetase/ligase [Bifidobacteriaceae bacterium]|nr:AMP-dependent synthetase/ligase [Bifidobacteriaceae bacterium]MCI1979506.1 AMP-dependent synthetase/ligase [Bifidobacteriaceae bacterium]